MHIPHLHPLETGQITDDLYAVKTGTVNFFIYQSAAGLLCIDSGYGKVNILRQLARLGIDPRQVTHLFLTHSDFDHAGGVHLFPNAQIYLSAAEEPMITGKKARALGCLYNARLRRPYHLLADEAVLSLGSTQVRAIATPGHTAGSMSYLLDEFHPVRRGYFQAAGGRGLRVESLYQHGHGTAKGLHPQAGAPRARSPGVYGPLRLHPGIRAGHARLEMSSPP